MKQRLNILSLFIIMIFLAACSGDNSITNTIVEELDVEASIEEIEIVNEDVSNENKALRTITDENYIDSDALPETWHGDWVCVYSEAGYFIKEETLFIKDFDNAVRYVNLSGGSAWEVNRWFLYNEEAKIIYIYNEPPPFKEGNYRDSFEIKRESDDELILTREHVGQEVRFEKYTP